MLLVEKCQAHNAIGVWSKKDRLRFRLSGLELRSTVRRFFKTPQHPVPKAQVASTFDVGDWVKVRDRAQIERTLDASGKCRGLGWVSQQWAYCGTTHRVAKVVRRIIDDSGKKRRVTRTVLFEDVNCDGPSGQEGCGRGCPLFFREEWLEPASFQDSAVDDLDSALYARVRSLSEIRATLDIGGGCDGLMFMPEMIAYAGARLPIRKQILVAHEGCHDRKPRAQFYLLKRSYCTGAILGQQGLCDRRCPFVWHANWLIIEKTGADKDFDLSLPKKQAHQPVSPTDET